MTAAPEAARALRPVICQATTNITGGRRRIGVRAHDIVDSFKDFDRQSQGH